MADCKHGFESRCGHRHARDSKSPYIPFPPSRCTGLGESPTSGLKNGSKTGVHRGSTARPSCHSISLTKVTELPTNAGELAKSGEIRENGPNESPLRHHESLSACRASRTRLTRISSAQACFRECGIPIPISQGVHVQQTPFRSGEDAILPGLGASRPPLRRSAACWAFWVLSASVAASIRSMSRTLLVVLGGHPCPQ
jgi:hypothetical protein